MRLVAEFGSVLMIGTSSFQMSTLDCVQNFAERLSLSQFIPLHIHRNAAAAIGLICKLLDGNCCEQLQKFCPVYLPSILPLRRSQQ